MFSIERSNDNRLAGTRATAAVNTARNRRGIRQAITNSIAVWTGSACINPFELVHHP